MHEPCQRDPHQKKKKLNMRVTVVAIIVDALATVPKCLKEDWKNWRSEHELKSCGSQYYYDRLEYSEESKTPEETC